MYGLICPSTGHRSKPERAAADHRPFFAETCLSECGESFGIDLKSHPILLAVSGGKDSMAMAGHVKAWHDRYGKLQLRAVIVDHGLRDDSSEEARLVKTYLHAMGIDAKICTVKGKPPSNGVQAWAREKRYALLAEETRLNDSSPNMVVLTAHHAHDQAETISMRLAAGSGLAGLAGMQKRTALYNMTVLRPFLEIAPGRLHHILDMDNIPYVEDPSNRNERFERIALRTRMDALAEEGITIPALLKLGDLSKRLMAVFNNHLSASMAGCCGVTQLGAIWFKRAELLALPIPAMMLFLRQIVQKNSSSKRPVSHDAVAILGKKLQNKNNNGTAATLGGLEWHLRGELVWVYPEAELNPSVIEIDAGRTLYDGIWQIMSPMAGHLRPLGRKGAAEIKERYPEFLENLAEIECNGVKCRLPQRALWRLPVLYPDPEPEARELSQEEGLITLEDGAIIPHVLRCEHFKAGLPLRITMCHNRECY
jgi:tRNA(Ile)-lysidine synthase